MREAAWEDDAELDFEEESRAKFAAWRAVAVHADMEEESLRLERVSVSLEIARRKNDDEWKWQNVIKLRNYELSRLPPNVAVITWKILQFLAWVGTLSGRTKNKPILTKEPVWFSSIFYLFVSIFNFDSFLWRA